MMEYSTWGDADDDVESPSFPPMHSVRPSGPWRRVVEVVPRMYTEKQPYAEYIVCANV